MKKWLIVIALAALLFLLLPPVAGNAIEQQSCLLGGLLRPFADLFSSAEQKSAADSSSDSAVMKKQKCYKEVYGSTDNEFWSQSSSHQPQTVLINQLHQERVPCPED